MYGNCLLFFVVFLKAMALEEVLLDEDSEDEINEYAEEVEERRVCTII